MSNNIRKIWLEGKEVGSLSLFTYVTCARKYGDQLFQVICLAAEDVNTRNNQSFAFLSSSYIGYLAGNRAVYQKILEVHGRQSCHL